MQVSSSSHFDKNLVKLYKSDSSYKAKVAKTVKELVNLNPATPGSIMIHKLSGTENYSISVDMSIRIVCRWRQNEIFLSDIGKHEDVY